MDADVAAAAAAEVGAQAGAGTADAAADLGAAAAPEAGNARPPADVPGRAAPADRPAPGRGRLVASRRAKVQFLHILRIKVYHISMLILWLVKLLNLVQRV